MRRPFRAALAAAVALGLSTLALAPSASAALSDQGVAHRNVPVCAAPTPGLAACHAIRHDPVDSQGEPVQPAVTQSPSGYGPADIVGAYSLPATPAARTSGLTPTVAIIDAYDDPSAATDLATYRSTMKLPTCNGCFKKVNQSGGSAMPRVNGGWAQEISLDVDMVSATCPACNILLVEANSSSFANLSAAVAYAAGVPGVVAISNSYGGSDTADMAAYDQPGIAVTASTGDNGYGVEAPASFSTVVAVGGTSLTYDSTTHVRTETAWSGAGSGCSAINVQPQWQTLATTGCPRKVNADVSAVANPNTGVAVYDTTSYQGRKGWMVFGGTSVSSPIIASVYALGSTATGRVANATNPASSPWNHQINLHDVGTGSNGSCGGTSLCSAGSGWDGPTGLGTPNGTAAF